MHLENCQMAPFSVLLIYLILYSEVVNEAYYVPQMHH